MCAARARLLEFGQGPGGPRGAGRPGHFYQRTAAVTAAWAVGLGLEARRCCDIGGSTGRLVHELARRLPDAEELVLAEPSAAFCTWARRLLLGEDFDRWMPVPDGVLRPTHRRGAPARPPQPAPPPVFLHSSPPSTPTSTPPFLP